MEAKNSQRSKHSKDAQQDQYSDRFRVCKGQDKDRDNRQQIENTHEGKDKGNVNLCRK